MTDLTPREIGSELDRFISGQRDAKRAGAGAPRRERRGAHERPVRVGGGGARRAARPGHLDLPLLIEQLF